MSREIVLDTETTGLKTQEGHRIIEIGCVELVNRVASGKVFHAFVNPARDVPHDAFRIHGISTEFLQDKPPFASIADALLAFLEDSPIVAHNASFDFGFVNFELKKAGRPEVPQDRIIDTLRLARTKHGSGGNRLDDLCKRYGIDNSRRTKHGALLDAELLAEVYCELTGGRQSGFDLAVEAVPEAASEALALVPVPRDLQTSSRLTPESASAHRQFVEKLGPSAFWKDHLGKETA